MSQENEMLLRLNTLYPRLASYVIGCTPEKWNDFSVKMETTDGGVFLSLVSNEDKKDVVNATKEIAFAASEIIEVFTDHNSMFNKAVFKVWLDDGKWMYMFEHDKQP